MIPLYPHSGFNFWSKIKTKMSFFNLARSALYLIAKEYQDSIFLLPSYTCPTVWHTLKQANVKYDFIDIDDTLDFDLEDLDFALNKYKNSDIVLISTALFGSKIRDYKMMYPNLIIIEDRAQGIFDITSTANFQLLSYGKGKLISGFGGGAVYDKYCILNNQLKSLSVKNDFLRSYLFSIIQKVVSRIWFILENTKYDPEESTKLLIDNVEPSLLSKYKVFWILNTINDLDFVHRIRISNYYLKHIKKEYLYNIKMDVPYLRMPIKKNICFSGVSKIRDFHETYYAASKRKKIEQKGAKILTEGSFLPTHDLVSIEYAQELVRLINE